MRSGARIGKAAAVVSSFLLMGVFVYWRAGGVLPGIRSAVAAPPAARPAAAATPSPSAATRVAIDPRQMASSSKYIAVVPPGSNPSPAGGATLPAVTIDPGQMILTTKSGAFIPPQTVLNATAATQGSGTLHIEAYQLSGTTKSTSVIPPGVVAGSLNLSSSGPGTFILSSTSAPNVGSLSGVPATAPAAGGTPQATPSLKAILADTMMLGSKSAAIIPPGVLVPNGPAGTAPPGGPASTPGAAAPGAAATRPAAATQPAPAPATQPALPPSLP